MFLLLGVLGGTVLALLAGLFVAARAMRPIVELTDAAREIERTRDPSRQHPPPRGRGRDRRAGPDAGGDARRARRRPQRHPDDARPPARVRRRRLARAAHAADQRARQPRAAGRGARRRAGRDRRGGAALDPADAPAGRRPAAAGARRRPARRSRTGRPTSAEVLVEAAAELGPMAERPRALDRRRAGDRRTASATSCTGWSLNLLENAVRHTPPGTQHAAPQTATRDGDAVLIVRGRRARGSPPSSRERVFERFVRGGRDGGRGLGAGAGDRARGRRVARRHGRARAARATGTGHAVRDPDPGGRRAVAGRRAATEPAPRADQTSTTTGSTIGRRRNRS